MSVQFQAEPPGRTDQEGFFRLIYDVHLTVMRTFNRRVKHLGLTRPQWEVITVLRMINGATQTEIADRMEMGRSPLGKIIDKLEALEFVERRPDEDDRRINRVFLTEKFTPMLAPMREVARDIEAIAFAGMSEDEIQQLRASIKMMRSNLIHGIEHPE